MNLRIMGLIGALSVVWIQASRADVAAPSTMTPQNEQQVQERLKAFDPAAVAAAQHYYNSPIVKSGMLSMVTSLTPAIMASISKQQPKQMSDADRQKAVTILNDAMRQNFDFLIGLNTIAALQTFSKEQLVALDKFYSSSVGQEILSKMPALSKSLPGILQAFMPKYLASVRTSLKAQGLDGK